MIRYTPVAGRTVDRILAAGAQRHPERLLLVYEAADGSVASFGWADVLDRSLALAALLRERGVGAGDRIHLQLENRPEFLFTWFAAAALGAAIVPTNTGASAAELAYIIEHSGATLSITEADHRELTVQARGGDGAVLCCDRDALGALASARPAFAAVQPDAELGVLYTSGTTSRPKGVRVTHANYIYAGEVVARAVRISPEDRLLAVLPLFHANAQYYSSMSALVAGATLVLTRRFSATRFLEQAIRHDATVASLFAAPIRMLLSKQRVTRRHEHRLRCVLFAQNLTPDQLALWEQRVGAPLVQLYGMTETIGPPLINPVDGSARADSLGRVSLGYSVRVVHSDGAPTRPGEPGQLLVGGTPGVELMRGYLDDPAATQDALRDGWLHTGDVVTVDDDGFFYFVARAKDMIRRSGENIAASEVETVLEQHPDVEEAAVVGVPDPVYDEQIVAFVVMRGAGPDAAALRRFCAQRLAKFRVPSRIVALDALPRTAVGKIRKGELRHRAQAVDRGD